MTTNTLEHRRSERTAQSQGRPRILRRIGGGLLAVIVTLAALISALPVILLFFVTSVPVLIAAGLVVIDLGIIAALFWLDRTPLTLAGAVAGWIAVTVLAVLLSQHFATTPPITDANGRVIPGSIATLESVELNGSTQWMTIRGHSQELPVLLFLAGGPGGSELAMTRRYLAELEKHFIIVNWDQPGVGKSYNAVPNDQLTQERFVSDGHALTLYLRERFAEDKITIFGESWGSMLGVWLVQQHPELYHALVTTGQMVAPVANDIEMYEFALEQAVTQGRTDVVEALRRNGPPPYTRNELVGKFQAMNGIVNNYMHAHAHGEGTGHNLMFDSLGAPEYGLLDKVYWALSLLNTFPNVYSQLNAVDLRTQAAELDVPVYVVKGRWDLNASNALAEAYFDLLDAPHKAWFWFEDSAHTPGWDEPARFTDVMVNTVLAQTQMEAAAADR
jgi:pimeloyl-ACP methyl ester carboxylesterase